MKNKINTNSFAECLSQKEFRRGIKLTQESCVKYFNFHKLIIHTCASLKIVREIKSGEYQLLYYLGHSSVTCPTYLCRVRSGIFAEVNRFSLAAYACICASPNALSRGEMCPFLLP
jgi:hypothetical protein